MAYTRLFEPGRIGGLELKNRIVMPAMGCSLVSMMRPVSELQTS